MENQNSYTFNFKVFIQFIIELTLLLICLGGIFNYIFEEKIIFSNEISGAAKINRIITKTYKNEIPIFGSSRANCCYVPSIINDDCYNYGIDGTKAHIWLFFLEQELKKNKTSDIIINFDFDGFLYSTGDLGNYLPNYKSVKHLLLNNIRYYYNIPFIKYFGYYDSYLKFYINEKINYTKHTDRGGTFDINNLTTKKFKEEIELRKKTHTNFTFNDTLINSFYKLIKSTKRKIYIIVAPYHYSYFFNFDNISKVNDFLDKIDTEQNITVVDFRNVVTNDSLFLNTTHLNFEGAKQFSMKLHNKLFLK